MLVTRLLRILTIFAMLLAPLGMMGGHAAMAMPMASASAMVDMEGMAPAGHCADMDKESQDRTAPGIDCMIACSAIATANFQIESHPMLTASILPRPMLSGLSGLHPESDPPPPRLS